MACFSQLQTETVGLAGGGITFVSESLIDCSLVYWWALGGVASPWRSRTARCEVLRLDYCIVFSCLLFFFFGIRFSRSVRVPASRCCCCRLLFLDGVRVAEVVFLVPWGARF